MSAPHEKYIFYHYNPSLPAAAVFVACFGMITLIHGFQILRYRSWFLILFLVGGILEILGYVGRILSAQQTPDWTLVPFIIQTLGLLLAPAFFAASIYMILGRVILYSDGEEASMIKRRVLTKTFVTGDVISLLAQAGGGGFMGSTKPGRARIGQYVVLGGLIVQILFFAVFVVVALVFHIRITQRPSARSVNRPQWKKHIWVLYGTSLLILIRSVFRVVEYVQGNDGYIFSKEAFLYALDGALMLVVMVTMSVVHPHELQVHSKEVDMQNYESKRGWERGTGV